MNNEISFRAGTARVPTTFNKSDELMFKIFGVDPVKLVGRWPLHLFLNIGMSSVKRMRLDASGDEAADGVDTTQIGNSPTDRQADACACGSEANALLVELRQVKLELIREKKIKWYKRHNETESVKPVEPAKDSDLSEHLLGVSHMAEPAKVCVSSILSRRNHVVERLESDLVMPSSLPQLCSSKPIPKQFCELDKTSYSVPIILANVPKKKSIKKKK